MSQEEDAVTEVGKGADECTSSSKPSNEAFQQEEQIEVDDVVGYLPRYAAPNVSSLLPSYANTGPEFIFRTFNTGNYDQIRHLPNDLKEQQILLARATRMAAAQQMSASINAQNSGASASKVQGVFQAFEYLSSPLSLYDEYMSALRVEGEVKRMTIGDGKEFKPADSKAHGKNEDPFAPLGEPKPTFPYLGGEWLDPAYDPYPTDAPHRGPFYIGAGTGGKLHDVPTRAVMLDVMQNIKAWIQKDWEGIDLEVYENDKDFWVIRIVVDTVDSLHGLVTYMNVFLRCNEIVNKYFLNKVVEFWGVEPGDGCIYFTLRPPWAKQHKLEGFFTMHPEEKDWRTSTAVLQMQQSPKKPASKD